MESVLNFFKDSFFRMGVWVKQWNHIRYAFNFSMDLQLYSVPRCGGL